MPTAFYHPPGIAPIGQAWLHQHLDLAVSTPAVRSYTVQAARRTEVQGHRIKEYYPRSYAVEATPKAHLRFALRYEPFDTGVLVAALKSIAPAVIEDWVRAEPTGSYSRRAWFFYETFTGKTLDLEDARAGNYAEALDPDLHIVASRRNSPRHRVVDNLLGGPGLCPTVRRTAHLAARGNLHIDEEARAMLASYGPAAIARATNYLYTKETRSSFAIEGETPNANRTERFVAALMSAPNFTPAKPSLIELQAQIVDPRYAAQDWRAIQNFVAQTAGGYQQKVHFICPRPQDLPSLMEAWLAMTERVVTSDIDAVVAAAVSSFAFVFIHPFEDGNGRIHRFLMHHILAKRRYSPPGVIFPVSAAILRDTAAYDAALETFSRPITQFIQWDWTNDQEIAVANDTAHLYRYFDATHFAEYLYDRVADTVRHDLKEELAFIDTYDRAHTAVREIVDMPDRRLALFLRLCLQNNGQLSKVKRSLFAEVTDAELAQLEAAIQEAMAAPHH